MAGLPSCVCKWALVSQGLHMSLEKALLAESGHAAADVIGQRPWSLNPGSSSTSDSSVENKFINRQFYWMLHTQAYFSLPCDDSVHFWSQDKHSIVHVTGFLRTVQEVVWGSPISFLPPFPTHLSHCTENTGVSGSDGEHKRYRLEEI